jgi:hypothetical protein
MAHSADAQVTWRDGPKAPLEPFEASADLEQAFLRTLYSTAKEDHLSYLSDVVAGVWARIANSSGSRSEAGSIGIKLLGFKHSESDSIFANSKRTVVVGLREVARLCQTSAALAEHLTRTFVYRLNLLYLL